MEALVMTSLYLKEKLQADRHLTILLDKGMKNVAEVTEEQGSIIYNGIERLSWYSSCFFDNYKDICAGLKDEDVRMMLAVKQIWIRNDVIFDMVKIYVDLILNNLTEERIKKIQKSLVKYSAVYSSSTMTNRAIAYSITKQICSNFGFKMLVREKLNMFSNYAVMVLSTYGRVQQAAEAANRLKLRNHTYYTALRVSNIEMLYFLIEPYLTKNAYFGVRNMSDSELISTLDGLIRG